MWVLWRILGMIVFFSKKNFFGGALTKSIWRIVPPPKRINECVFWAENSAHFRRGVDNLRLYFLSHFENLHVVAYILNFPKHPYMPFSERFEAIFFLITLFLVHPVYFINKSGTMMTFQSRDFITFYNGKLYIGTYKEYASIHACIHALFIQDTLLAIDCLSNVFI